MAWAWKLLLRSRRFQVLLAGLIATGLLKFVGQYVGQEFCDRMAELVVIAAAIMAGAITVEDVAEKLKDPKVAEKRATAYENYRNGTG